MRKQKTSDFESEKTEYPDDDVIVEESESKIKGIVKLVSPEYIVIETVDGNTHINTNELEKQGIKNPKIGDNIEI